MGKDVGEIRRLLQVFDQAGGGGVGVRQALGMLEGITKCVAQNPDGYDLLEEPDEAEAWSSAGGDAYCENEEFTNRLAARWLEVLSRPDFGNAGYDKDELGELRASLKRWIAALDKVGLEFGDVEELMSLLEELTQKAPEAEEDSSD